MSLIDVDGLPPMIAQARLIEAIARSIVSSVEPGWTAIHYWHLALSATSEGGVRVASPDRDLGPRVPREAVKMAKQLRDVMYVKGFGTWFTFDLQIDASLSVTSGFNYDDEPAWKVDVDPIAYVVDQHTHPRDAQNQPVWLQEKIATGWARINELPAGQRPAWVQRHIDEGTHDLTAEGLVAKQ
ncbi:hypothetical protein [Cellulomonas sp. URHB0016]